MNKNLLKNLAIAAVVAAGGLAVGLFRTSAPQMQNISSLISGPVLELPANAARLVAQAADKQATAAEVMRAMTGIAQPDMIPPVVSAICHAAPETAGATVAAALAAQPGSVIAIAKAAMAAAPGSVAEIVAAVCRQTPQAHNVVAFIAVQQVPNATDKILNAISESMPDLAPHIAAAKTYSGDLSVSSILKRADALAQDLAVEEAKVAKLTSAKNLDRDLAAPHEVPMGPFVSANNATTANGPAHRARTQLSFMDQSVHAAFGEVILPRFGAPFVALGGNIKEVSVNDLIVIEPGQNYSRP